MGRSGLILLLLTLGILHPASLVPLQPMCDQSVMDKYIQDASTIESEIEQLCRTSCRFPEPVTVLDTRVNFPAWKAMDRSRQASEVWRGQALLSAAVLQVKRQQPAAFLHHLEAIESHLRSIREILRGHHAQAAAQDEPSSPTLSVRTVKKLVNVYSSFLRGKVNLFVSGACRGDGR
uniref:Erythropoietin n=2 Tax=Pogona vitticeps TaxID=103695 RepID=A0A6J0U6C3_9SAUR